LALLKTFHIVKIWSILIWVYQHTQTDKRVWYTTWFIDYGSNYSRKYIKCTLFLNQIRHEQLHYFLSNFLFGHSAANPAISYHKLDSHTLKLHTYCSASTSHHKIDSHWTEHQLACSFQSIDIVHTNSVNLVHLKQELNELRVQ
jgi:hypothetical protein